MNEPAPGRIEIRGVAVSRLLGPGRREMPAVLGRLLAFFVLTIAWVEGLDQALRHGVAGVPLELLFFFVLPALGVVAFTLLVRFVARLRKVHLSIGADGIRLQRLGRRRFIPHAHVRRLVDHDGHLVFEERGEPPLRLIVTDEGDGAGTWAERLESLRAGYGKAASLAPLEALLSGTQTYDPQWLAVLRRATRREDYREAPLTTDNLWPLVEDASVSPAERVAAAVALRAELDDAGRTRLRVAVDSTLSPRVRVALEAALEEDDEQLTRSFTELTTMAVEEPGG